MINDDHAFCPMMVNFKPGDFDYHSLIFKSIWEYWAWTIFSASRQFWSKMTVECTNDKEM